MKLRRAALAALAAAAVSGTVAMALPTAAPGRPQPLPPLTARALASRYAADSRAITRAMRAAERSGDSQRARALAALRARQVVFFSPRGAGLAGEVIGNLATARRVAILVPGADTSLSTFFAPRSTSPGDAASALAAEAHRLAPGQRLAVIAWLGYPTPDTISPAVLTSGDAGQGAQSLRLLVGALARHGDQVALLCHSYGSVVCGRAAPHLPAADIAVFGSPGMDASSVRALHTTARVWAGLESGDGMRYVPHIRLFGLGFGTNPVSAGFGARMFATGSGGHSDYLRPGSASLRNLTLIALGRAAEVTR